MNIETGLMMAGGIGLFAGCFCGYGIGVYMARDAWLDGWRNGIRGNLCKPDPGLFPPPDGKAPVVAMNTRRGLELHVPEVACTANSEYDADLDMWRTISPEDEEEAVRQRDRLAVGVWVVFLSAVAVLGMLLFARHVFVVEERAQEARKQADKAVFADQQARAAAEAEIRASK